MLHSLLLGCVIKLIPRTTKELRGNGRNGSTQTCPRSHLPHHRPISTNSEIHKCRWAPNLQRSSTRCYSEQQVRCLYSELPIHDPLGYSAVFKVKIPDADASSIIRYAGLGYDWVKFSPQQLVWGYVFVVQSVNNQDVFITAEQSLHSIKAFLLLTPAARKLGMHKRLGGHTARTADPNWSERYFMLNT